MKKRVLLVDDENAILFAYSKCLRRIGCLVDAVATQEEAENLLIRNRYDFAILDIRLGNSSGEEGLQLMEVAKKSQEPIRLIMITAYGSEKIKEKAYQQGAELYLEKPVSIELIQKVIENE